MSLTSYRAAPPRGREGREEEGSVLCGPGGDLLSRVLRQSTIGAEAFDGRVRDGIGSYRLAKATRPAKGRKQKSETRSQKDFGCLFLFEAKLVFSIPKTVQKRSQTSETKPPFP